MQASGAIIGRSFPSPSLNSVLLRTCGRSGSYCLVWSHLAMKGRRISTSTMSLWKEIVSHSSRQMQQDRLLFDLHAFFNSKNLFDNASFWLLENCAEDKGTSRLWIAEIENCRRRSLITCVIHWPDHPRNGRKWANNRLKSLRPLPWLSVTGDGKAEVVRVPWIGVAEE